jgi:hypothetical protein
VGCLPEVQTEQVSTPRAAHYAVGARHHRLANPSNLHAIRWSGLPIRTLETQRSGIWRLMDAFILPHRSPAVSATRWRPCRPAADPARAGASLTTRFACECTKNLVAGHRCRAVMGAYPPGCSRRSDAAIRSACVQSAVATPAGVDAPADHLPASEGVAG